MPSSRKRYNAFEDFPEEEISVQLKKPEAKKNTQVQSVERIERLKPSQMMPDRFQPRRLLPTAIRSNFFSRKIDCYQAAAQWLSLSRTDAGIQQEIDLLLAMGSSFESHGQIKPITGSWDSKPDGSFVFIIETGERRFWAACLQFASGQIKEEPYLRVEIITSPTRQRQVLENRHAEPPSAVGMACEIASLILAELKIQPDLTIPDEFEYFRQARNQRMPAGLWERVMPIMQITRPRMVQLLNILQLPTPTLEIADRHRLPERVLREILLNPRDQWDSLVRLSVQSALTSDDIAEINPLKPEPVKKEKSSTERIIHSSSVFSGAIIRFFHQNSVKNEKEQSMELEEVAEELISSPEGIIIGERMIQLSHIISRKIDRLKK